MREAVWDISQSVGVAEVDTKQTLGQNALLISQLAVALKALLSENTHGRPRGALLSLTFNFQLVTLLQ